MAIDLGGLKLARAVSVGALALWIAGCGSSSHHTSVASTASTSASVPTTTRARHPPRPSTTTTASAATVSNAPSPAPAGTPPAPDGLRQTTGYATYELCAGRCSGAVPASLRRPLHLPHVSAGCPVSGSGPVKPAGSPSVRLSAFVGSAWRGARVTWDASATYSGPVLIRGRRLGGRGAIGFGEGHVPYDELQLLDSGQGASPGHGGARQWLTLSRAKAPGCYAYQVDGVSFSDVIVFAAR